MAQLYFKYGAMGSSKTANALMARFNYEERGQATLLVKPQLDTSELEFDRVCKNPKCISQVEQELPQLFRCTDKAADIHRCIYCEQRA